MQNELNNINICKLFFENWKFPEDLNISTMTVTCKTSLLFNVENIGRYLNLNADDIIEVKYGNLPIRSLIYKKARKRKKKKVQTSKQGRFFNQVSIIMAKKAWAKTWKKINVKLFTNGSIQMTGCKSIEHIIETITSLFEKLKVIKAIVDPLSLRKVIEKPFVSDTTKLNINNIKAFKICMINSNFVIGFKINRDKLYQLLKNENYYCHFDPNSHACVNIKYQYNELKYISIFVFESGAIVITGANNYDHIIAAYKFINTYLINNYHDVIKRNLIEDDNKVEEDKYVYKI